MTNPESIIEHKDITEKVINTRAELINERFADNPEKNRPLVFRGYISEADRIKDVIKQNKYLYYLPDYEKIKQEKKRLKALSQDNNASKTFDQNNINRVLNSKYTINNDTDRFSINNPENINASKSSKKNTIFQPTMRYKPRTDLERVYDILNGYNYNQASRDIIERQLKSINLYDYKKNSINEGGKEESRILKRPRFLSKSLQRKTKKRKNTLIDKKEIPSDIDDLTNVNISNPTEGQALVYDETNDEWVNGSTGGGSGSLETAITSSISVGGIPSGTNYPVGTNYDNMWKDLLNPVAYPTLTNPSATLSATGAKLLETGSTLATTMTVAFNRGSISPAYGTSGYRSGTATDYALNGGTAQAGNTFSVTVDAEHLTYQASVSYGAGEQPKDSEGGNYSTPLAAGSVNSNTLTYEFVDALWANTTNIATIAKLALVSKSAKTKTFEFPAQTVANPEVFDVPASWTITAVDVLNTLSNQWEDCSGEFAITNVNHDDAAGTSVAYKRYTCALGYSTGARKIRIKWS